MVLDGDNLHHGLCADLDFFARRAAEVARLFSESGTICIAALIPPLQLVA